MTTLLPTPHDLALYGSLVAVLILFLGIVLQFEKELYK